MILKKQSVFPKFVLQNHICDTKFQYKKPYNQNYSGA